MDVCVTLDVCDLPLYSEGKGHSHLFLSCASKIYKPGERDEL